MSDIEKEIDNYLKFENDKVFKQEIENLVKENNEKELYERFYTRLSFGTAGMRGVIGGGTNRINSYMVSRISQALAIYLKKSYLTPSVVIAYDSRHFSREFAILTARVLATKNIKTYIYDTLHPVPMLSYAVRYLKASSGVVITSSHNPSKYNGYKVYNENGSQIVSPADKEITEIYNSITKIDEILSEKKLRSLDVIQTVPSDVDISYYENVLKSIRRKDLIKESDVKIVYTPLFGSGNVPVRDILKKLGFKCIVVKEQEKPNGDFPGLIMPNPEYPQTMEKALELAKKEKATMVLATDPDADRLGIAIANDKDCTSYLLLKGNQICVLLVDYLLLTYKEQNKNKIPLIIKSVVTTTLLDKICRKYNAKLETCLTGFKNIASVLKRYEDNKDYEFLFGCEESFGFLSIDSVRDKDAVSSAALASEMLCYYQSKNISIKTRLEQLGKEYGLSDEITVSSLFEGSSGSTKMKEIMDNLKNIKVGDEIGNRTIKGIRDLEKDPLEHSEKANVLIFDFSNGERLIVRPSGTEPKIKYYFFFNTSDNSLDFAKYCEESKDLILKQIT